VPTVRSGPVIGLIVQVVLLAALAGTVGLGVSGWLAGLAYGVVLCATLTRAMYRSAAAALGPADRVTLGRATLVGLVTALTADSLDRHVPVEVLVGIAAVALALDAVDGKVARRTGTASALGARFDMEVDAFLVLVLSMYVARPVGAWVLTIGAMRYGYVAAAWALPWLRGSLPPRYWRKVVAAVQGIVLVFATADVLPRPLLVGALAVAVALLVESFGHDVAWLWQHRLVQPRRRRASGPSSRISLEPRQGSRLLPLNVRPEFLAARYVTVRNRSTIRHPR
jgi:phosphatidylglycerophosphate synthase